MRTYTTISYCRACGHNQLDDCFSLGEHWVNDFPDKAHLDSGTRCPIDIVACPRCTLVQAKHTAPQDLLYSRHYWYKSGTSPLMRAALQDVVGQCLQRVKLNPGDVVLDIGSNDGTLLRGYSSYLRRVGVEPAENLATPENYHGMEVFRDFWPCNKRIDFNLNSRVKAITACGMFYDLDDPNPFIKGVAEVLHPDGVFCAQLMCLRQMIDACDVGNCCHEHLEFYTLRSLDYLYRRHGLVIEDVEQNKVNGGSYRIWARLDRPASPEQWAQVAPGAERLRQALEAEEGIVQQVPRFWYDLITRKAQLLNLLSDLRKPGKNGEPGKKVWAYGASTKGNTLLQFWGLSAREIDGAVDADPSKYGRYTVGSRILIVPKDIGRQDADVFLVLPYAFRDEIIEQEREFLANGGRLIFPLPNVEII